jgi:hypothetical protein
MTKQKVTKPKWNKSEVWALLKTMQKTYEEEVLSHYYPLADALGKDNITGLTKSIDDRIKSISIFIEYVEDNL